MRNPVPREGAGVLLNAPTSQRAYCARHKRALRAETAALKQRPRDADALIEI